jgi:hypothetical protein
MVRDMTETALDILCTDITVQEAQPTSGGYARGVRTNIRRNTILLGSAAHAGYHLPEQLHDTFCRIPRAKHHELAAASDAVGMTGTKDREVPLLQAFVSMYHERLDEPVRENMRILDGPRQW